MKLSRTSNFIRSCWKISWFSCKPSSIVEHLAKLQNTPPLISISLNKNINYCYSPRSSEHTDTCKWSAGAFWSCSLHFPFLLAPRSSIVLGQGFIVTIVCISFSQPILWDILKSFVATRIVYTTVQYCSSWCLLAVTEVTKIEERDVRYQWWSDVCHRQSWFVYHG